MTQNIYINAPKPRGCFSRIIRAAFFTILLLIALSFLLSRRPKNELPAPSPSVVSNAVSVVDTTIFNFVEAQTETRSDGFKNVMDIYCYDGPIDRDKLIELCRQQKAKVTPQTDVYFYRMILFDKPENVVASSTPIGSAYDLDEKAAIHIRAKYTHNRMNGFSELNWHDSNTYEHLPNTEKP